MKPEKATKAGHILLMTRRFNDVSRLVVSEIMRCPEMSKRVAIIEKWAAVADICRCLHNLNGVLQICAAFMNSSVFRLRKTWERVSKTTKQTIDKLQTLVSADGRFRNMRDALHRCDPPCIPYLGWCRWALSGRNRDRFRRERSIGWEICRRIKRNRFPCRNVPDGSLVHRGRHPELNGRWPAELFQDANDRPRHPRNSPLSADAVQNRTGSQSV